MYKLKCLDGYDVAAVSTLVDTAATSYFPVNIFQDFTYLYKTISKDSAVGAEYICCTIYLKIMDLPIRNFRLNRISNRIRGSRLHVQCRLSCGSCAGSDLPGGGRFNPPNDF